MRENAAKIVDFLGNIRKILRKSLSDFFKQKNIAENAAKIVDFFKQKILRKMPRKSSIFGKHIVVILRKNAAKIVDFVDEKY